MTLRFVLFSIDLISINLNEIILLLVKKKIRLSDIIKKYDFLSHC